MNIFYCSIAKSLMIFFSFFLINNLQHWPALKITSDLDMHKYINALQKTLSLYVTVAWG